MRNVLRAIVVNLFLFSRHPSPVTRHPFLSVPRLIHAGASFPLATRYWLLATFILALALLASSCGGGGGVSNTAAPPASPSGGITGYAIVPDNSSLRAASNGARATGKALAGATVTAITPSGAVTTQTNGNGAFAFTGLPVGEFTEVTAATGAVIIKMYAPVINGQITEKNITTTTTAAAIVYEKLKSGQAAPQTIDEVESSNLIAALVAEIENALADAENYSYQTLYNGAAADDIVTRVNSGAIFSDTAPPTLTITAPAPGASVPDTTFVTSAFQITFTYTDALSAADAQALAVTIRIDSGEPTAISPSNFAAVPSGLNFTLASGDLSAVTGAMLDTVTNLSSHTAEISVSIADISANTAAATATFTITPNVFNPPE